MEQKPRLLVYGRKEMAVLVFLAVLVAVFAFTLGVHLGKRVVPRPVNVGSGDPSVAATLPDKTGGRSDFIEQSKGVQQAVDDSLDQAVHDEVHRTGIRLDQPIQTKLPEKAVSKNAGATTSAAAPAAAMTTAEPYSLQVGSYPTMSEATAIKQRLEKAGLKPFLREADLKEKGRWYRVYFGGFPTKSAAEQAGESYRAKRVIESFIVAKKGE